MAREAVVRKHEAVAIKSFDGSHRFLGNQWHMPVMLDGRNYASVEHAFQAALGRRLEDYDMPLVRSIARHAATSDFKMSSFILGVVKSDAFTKKRVDAAPVTTNEAAAQDAGKQQR